MRGWARNFSDVLDEKRRVKVRLERRRELRATSTEAEQRIWFHLRGRRLQNFKFRRQYSCGPYILDFFCSERRLAIEIDGGQHYEPERRAYDARRTRYLAERGIAVVRFPCDEALRDTGAVLEAILEALAKGLRAVAEPAG